VGRPLTVTSVAPTAVVRRRIIWATGIAVKPGDERRAGAHDDLMQHSTNSARSGMRVLETAVYRGPHPYGSRPMVRLRIDLGELDAWPSDRIPGFVERLSDLLPGLATHGCSLGRPGGFLERLQHGTWLGHVVEHVAIELQRTVGSHVTRGKTRSVRGTPGVYDALFAYEDAEVGLAAGAVALRLVSSLLPEPFSTFDAGRLRMPDAAPEDGPIPGLTALRALAARRRLGPTTASLVEAARRRGIPVHLAGDGSLVRLGYGVNQRWLRASMTDATSHLAVQLAGDKQRTRQALAAAGLPVPAGEVVASVEEAIAAAERVGGAVVLKPLDGNHGRGVSVGLVGPEEVRQGFQLASRHARRVIVERFVAGRDYRALVVGGRLVAVAERRPARVLGDGVHTIDQLVESANADPRRGQGHALALTRIAIDEEAELVLAAQGLERTSVPPEGGIVLLHRTANLSTGGDAIDRTDQVHPRNVATLERAARTIGLDIAGIDLMCPDLADPLDEVGGGILEVNAAPGFRMHLAPSGGTPRDVARPVIDMLYPPGSTSLIPVVGVTGTNGKSTTVRMIAHIFAASGKRVGMTTTSGIYVDGERIAKLDASGPRSAQRVLGDPTVEVAVLEVARGGILREGLAVPRLDVGVMLNVSADHLGIGGVDTLGQLARVKSVVVRAVRRNGLSVLNADDERVARLADVAGGRIGWVTLQPLSPELLGRMQRGDLVAAVEAGWLVLHDGTARRHELLPVSQLPAALGGVAVFNLQNALAASAAAFARGIPPSHIAAALSTFESTFEQNPGRLNITRAPGFTTILDYGHNPAALTALGAVLAGMRDDHERLIGVVSTPGDRRDEDIREVGRIAAGIFDELVFRERPDGRGREAGAVVTLLQEGAVAGGASPEAIHIVLEERDAMHFALSSAGERDLVVLMPTDVEGSWRQVQEFAQERARIRRADAAASAASVEPVGA
jgi:cyanophycin synthetase